MADQPIRSTQSTRSPKPDAAPTDSAASSRRSHRPVYEPSLLPTRRRRRASPWVVIPGLLLLLGVILYVILVAPHQRRFVASAGRIAFASDQGSPGDAHIWISGPDGAGAHRLTSSAADEAAPAWSGDGSQIAFLSSAPGAEPQIVVADADGQNVRQVTRNSGAKSQPQFAPSDSSLLGYTAGGALSTADVLNGETVRLLPTVSETNRAQSADAAGATAQPPIMTAFSWCPGKDRAQQGLAAVEDAGGVQALVLLPTLSDKPHDARDDGAPDRGGGHAHPGMGRRTAPCWPWHCSGFPAFPPAVRPPGCSSSTHRGTPQASTLWRSIAALASAQNIRSSPRTVLS